MQKLLRVSAVLLTVLLTCGVLQLTPAAQAKGKGKKGARIQVTQDKNLAVYCMIDCDGNGSTDLEGVTDDAGSCCEACLDGCGASFCSGGNEEIFVACWNET